MDDEIVFHDQLNIYSNEHMDYEQQEGGSRFDSYVAGSEETLVEGNETFATRYTYQGKEYGQTKYEKAIGPKPEDKTTFIKGKFTGERLKTDPDTGKIMVDANGAPITEKDPDVTDEADKEQYETWDFGTVTFKDLGVVGQDVALSRVRHGRTEKSGSGSSWGDGELAAFPEGVTRPSTEELDAMVASSNVEVVADDEKKRVEKFTPDSTTTIYRERSKSDGSVHLGAVIDMKGTPPTELTLPKLFNEEGTPRERQETSLFPKRLELDLDNPPKKMPYGRVKFGIEYGEPTARTAA